MIEKKKRLLAARKAHAELHSPSLITRRPKLRNEGRCARQHKNGNGLVFPVVFIPARNGKKTASRDVSCNGTMRSEMQAPWRRKRIAFRTSPSCPINHGPGVSGSFFKKVRQRNSRRDERNDVRGARTCVATCAI